MKIKNNSGLKITAIMFALILTLTGCSTGKTDQELMAEGWVQNPAEQGWIQNPTELGYILPKELPAPVKEGTTEKPYAAVASSINAENLDQYLNRDDVLYIDLRDYKDYAQKHFKNFEVIPYFAFIFNESAHTDETKVQLYGGTPENPVAVYEESGAILNAIVPKDQTIFLMCQSGGRVTQFMNLLAAEGYDMSKIYNVGGMAQYTDSKYSKYITDTLEFTIDGTYNIEGVTRIK